METKSTKSRKSTRSTNPTKSTNSTKFAKYIKSTNSTKYTNTFYLIQTYINDRNSDGDPEPPVATNSSKFEKKQLNIKEHILIMALALRARFSVYILATF